MKSTTTRKKMFSNNVSHSLRRTRRTQNLNQQVKTVDGVKRKMTTREWKTFNKAA